MNKLPTGIYPHYNKFKAVIPLSHGNKYLGLFPDVETAVSAQEEHRRSQGITTNPVGRPRKEK
jgi:hypothetical protein